MITKEFLNNEIENLKNQRQQLLNSIMMCNGAIQTCEQLVAKIEADETSLNATVEETKDGDE